MALLIAINQAVATSRRRLRDGTSMKPCISALIVTKAMLRVVRDNKSWFSSSCREPPHLPSIGFSGAGFLGCYHLGVADCLLKHSIILGPLDKIPSSSQHPILLGASAGAIVAASICAGVRAEDGMNIVLEIRRRVKAHGGALDVLYPGVSLIDYVRELVLPAIQQAVGNDEELLMRRISNSRLRIALTRKSSYSLYGWAPLPASLVLSRTQKIISKDVAQVSNAYCYVDSYRSIEEVVSACILSSYIPGLTGPARGVDDVVNKAVRDATHSVLQLVELGAVKDGATGKALSLSDLSPTTDESDSNTHVSDAANKTNTPSSSLLEPFLDGGLSCVWPTVDNSTIIVCPIRANFDPNPAIFPELLESGDTTDKSISLSEDGLLFPQLERKIKTIFAMRDIAATFHGKKVHIAGDNAETLFRMMFSSSETILEKRFQQGYNDAYRFLKERSMLNVYTN